MVAAALAPVTSRWPVGTKWLTAPEGSLRGLGGLYLAQKLRLLLEGLPGAPRQLSATGQSIQASGQVAGIPGHQHQMTHRQEQGSCPRKKKKKNRIQLP